MDMTLRPERLGHNIGHLIFYSVCWKLVQFSLSWSVIHFASGYILDLKVAHCLRKNVDIDPTFLHGNNG